MDNIKLYKDISYEIISSIKNEELDKVSKLLDKRQEILEIEKNNKEFINALKSDGILEIDKEIKELLDKSIIKVKEEIKQHRLFVRANNSYTNSFKENLQIFYKKV